MTDVAIVGGGPGGLMTARLLERTFGSSCRLTMLEASNRLGGKIQTRRFDAAPVLYEAGVAECYAYEAMRPRSASRADHGSWAESRADPQHRGRSERRVPPRRGGNRETLRRSHPSSDRGFPPPGHRR